MTNIETVIDIISGFLMLPPITYTVPGYLSVVMSGILAQLKVFQLVPLIFIFYLRGLSFNIVVVALRYSLS